MFRRVEEPIPEASTSVWTCTGEDCNGWMRDNFSFVEDPVCPLCASSMTQEERVLPILTNYAKTSG